MKSEKGITLSALTITLVIMAIIGLTVFYSGKEINEETKDDLLIAELQTVHHIVLQEYNKELTLGEGNYEYKGTTTLSTIEDSIISQYLTDKFQGVTVYELDTNALKEIGAKNATSTYWVCYKTGEVANIDYTTSTGEVLYTK